MKQIDIIVKENEEKVFPFVWINDEEDNIKITVRLSGIGSSFQLIGLFLATQNYKVKFDTDVIHEAPKTKSMTSIRGVFKGTSSFDNDGMVRIHKGASGADGFFSSKILLFDDAKGRSVPSLEIDENDLKAGHGSTIGRPDPEQLIYLRSRGLTEKEASDLIVSGFFTKFIALFPKKEQKNIQKQIAATI